VMRAHVYKSVKMKKKRFSFSPSGVQSNSAAALC